MRVSTISGSVSFAAQTSIVVNQYLAVTIVYMLPASNYQLHTHVYMQSNLCGNNLATTNDTFVASNCHTRIGQLVILAALDETCGIPLPRLTNSDIYEVFPSRDW